MPDAFALVQILKTKDMPNFAWQSGYGALSIGTSEAKRLTRYVRDQASHHAKTSFEDEYRALLSEADPEFDERYL